MYYRDIVAVGSSMGGVEALQKLLKPLPGDLPASMLVVQHTSPEGPGYLAEILQKATSLKVKRAEMGEKIAHGNVYIASPNHHLMLEDSRIEVTFGPRENRFRPAINPLFRSAAVNYGARAIGIVLTGLLDDGAAGLAAIKRCGGTVIVQDPADALYPEMPRSALETVRPDYCLPLHKISEVLNKLVREEVKGDPMLTPIPKDILLEETLAKGVRSDSYILDELGHASSYTCPDCGGVLWRLSSGGLASYQCQVGHAFTDKGLHQIKSSSMEDKLWDTYRSMLEEIHILSRLTKNAKDHGRSGAVYEEELNKIKRHSDEVKKFLMERVKTKSEDDEHGIPTSPSALA